MSIIVCNCQHCDEQQFQTLSCVHYTIFSVVKLDLFTRALLLDRILALEKLRVRLAYIFLIHTSSFLRFLVFFSFFEKTTYCCRVRRLSVRASVVCGNNFFSR